MNLEREPAPETVPPARGRPGRAPNPGAEGEIAGSGALESADEVVRDRPVGFGTERGDGLPGRLAWAAPGDLSRMPPFPPRRQGSLPQELVASVRSSGVVAPLIVRPAAGGLQVVCGDRRLRAAVLAGLRHVPVLILPLGDVPAIRWFLDENACHRTLTPAERQEARRLLRDLRDAGEDAAGSAGPAPGAPGAPGGMSAGPSDPVRPTLVPAGEGSGAGVVPAPGESHAPARWEVEDLLARTQDLLDGVRRERRVDVRAARDLVDELLVLQGSSRPLGAEDVYREWGEGWLAAHSLLVASMNAALAPGGISEERRRTVALAGLLHDVGMVFLEPRGILTAGRALSEGERAEVREHTRWGHALIAALGRTFSEVALAARDHHERDDGSGYPAGLDGSRIAPLARLTGLTDTYAALVGPRPYRARRPRSEALEYVTRRFGGRGYSARAVAKLEGLGGSPAARPGSSVPVGECSQAALTRRTPEIL